MSFDRAARLRTRPDDLAALERDPRSVVVPLWRNRNLVAHGRPARAALLTLAALGELADGCERVLLGLLAGRGCFALDLAPADATPSHPRLAEAGAFSDLRMVGGLLPAEDAGLCAYARAITHWHRHHRHCGTCGAATRSAEAGHVRVCGGCERRHFPRTDPCVMVLVTRGDRCVLARQPAFPPGMYSVLAGFVEPGETLEEAAAREVREEVGLGVTDLAYLRSQPWPFPASLMIGFAARTEEEALTPDAGELEDARWLSRDELRRGAVVLPPPYSLANHLVTRFLEDIP
jgi:NAD+ diphosphatase